MSFSGWRTATLAADVLPSAKVSLIVLAVATTWRLVRMSPWSSMMTPLPSPDVDPSLGLVSSTSTSTSEGAIAA